MAINVNYYPSMRSIADIAYGGGQTQEGIRQQDFGLNVEQLAQRERMQNQDIGFRQGAQMFDAQVGLEQQRRGIAANQQSQMYAQAGRERLAMFDAAQRQQQMQQQLVGQYGLQQQEAANRARMQQEAFQQQQMMQQQDYALKQGYTKDMLTWEGQQKMAEFERQRDAIRQWAEDRPGTPPELIQDAMRKIDLREAGFDYDPFKVDKPLTLEEKIAQRVGYLPDGSGMVIEQPGGELDFRPTSKTKEGTVGIWEDPETGQQIEVPPGVRKEDKYGVWQWKAGDGWELTVPRKDLESNTPPPPDPIKRWEVIDRKTKEILEASKGYSGEYTIKPEDARNQALKYLREANHPWFATGNPELPSNAEDLRTSASPNYGTLLPPSYAPPKFVDDGNGNQVTFSRDGKYIYAEDVPIGQATQEEAMQIASMSPTATTSQQIIDLPNGVYFNYNLNGNFKPVVKMTDEVRERARKLLANGN